MMHCAATATISRVIVAPTKRGSTFRSLHTSFCGLASSSLSSPSKRLPGISVGLVNRPATLIASFSTTPSEGIGGRVRSWLENRSSQKQQKQYMEQMERFSEIERLTLGTYKLELDHGLNQWVAKIPFMQSKEVQTAKETVAVVKALIDVKGIDATVEDLDKMDRLERLKVATSTNKTLEEISIIMTQIQSMDLMHRILRKRHKEGKPIPPDPDKMQTVIKKEAAGVMTKAEKQMIMQRQQAAAKRSMRKK